MQQHCTADGPLVHVADSHVAVLQLVFQQNQHITKLDYEEAGPTVVHKKCC